MYSTVGRKVKRRRDLSWTPPSNETALLPLPTYGCLSQKLKNVPIKKTGIVYKHPALFLDVDVAGSTP